MANRSESIGEIIENLKRDNVTLEQIEKELDYRSEAGKDSRWDDNLFEYSTDELESIEVNWK